MSVVIFGGALNRDKNQYEFQKIPQIATETIGGSKGVPYPEFEDS